MTNTPSSAARQDPTDRVSAEPTVLDISPAIYLAEHRAEAAVCGVYPILQRAHRAGAKGRDAPDGDGARGPKSAAEDEVNASLREWDLLDVKADQRGTAESSGSSRRPARSPGQVVAMRVRRDAAGGGVRRRVAVRRACRSSVVTAGSDAGDASPCERCWAAIAAVRRANAPALSRAPRDTR